MNWKGGNNIKANFRIGVKNCDAINGEFNSISEMVTWIENDMPELYSYEFFLPHFITIAENEYCVAIIDMHTVPYGGSRDTIFKIVCRAIMNEIEVNPDLQGIEIKF